MTLSKPIEHLRTDLLIQYSRPMSNNSGRKDPVKKKLVCNGVSKNEKVKLSSIGSGFDFKPPKNI